MVAAVPGIAVLRDPTRGGLSATLNEIAGTAHVGMRLDEAAIPVKPDVAAACELLGLDPLHVANEGKLVCICAGDDADRLLDGHARASAGARRGADRPWSPTTTRHLVQMKTGFGGMRVVDWLAGEQLPRIC